jgi:hypothetical protein
MGLQIKEKEFLILNHLDIFRSIMDIDPVQKSTGFGSEEIVTCLSKFKEEGIVVKEMYEGREKWKITPAGEKIANSYRQLMLAGTAQKEAVTKKFEHFENFFNVRLKEFVTDWQMKIVEGAPVLNDHSDSEYDSAILRQIFDLHENVIRTLEEMVSAIPMLKNYIGRLNFAIEKLREGKLDYLTKNKESYHNIWFELHESILKLWGRERIE